MQRRHVVLVVVAGALALPGRALAVDHVVLFVSPTRLASAPSPLAAWKLSAAVVGATSPQTRETFGVSLRRSFLNRRAEELHAFRAAPAQTVSFDGRSGRWNARFAGGPTIAMTITATGSPQPVEESQGCRGGLLSVPVSLRGSFVLRTATTFFKTIRRARLSGTVTFNPGGAVDCTPATAASCTPSTVLTAVKQGASGPAATLLASPDAGGWLSLSFADRRPGAAGATWYHVLRIERLGYSPLSGRLPRISLRLSGTLPVSGSGTLLAPQTSTQARGACRRETANGSFRGSFRTRFAGWGVRTSRFEPGDEAQYAEER
ncbi:MAG: hypothetical protein ACRDNB_12750 [Gaiellaceae bacterium]